MPDARPNGVFPIDEGDVLALIEGESLPPERAAAVAGALQHDPALARRVEAMRRDRADLLSLGAERAPAGLVQAVAAAVEPAMERRMLLGLEQSAAPLYVEMPVTVIRAARASGGGAILASIFAGRGRRLALAAGLVLVVCGASVLMVRSGASPAPVHHADSRTQSMPVETPANPGPLLARSDSSQSGAPLATGSIAMPGTDPGAHQLNLAASDPHPGGVVGPREARPAEHAGVDQTPVITLAQAQPAPSMDPTEALRLAREHRLLIVIRSPNAEDASNRLGRFTSRTAPSLATGWRVAADVPSSVVASLARGRGDALAAPPVRFIPPIDTDLLMAIDSREPMRSRGLASRLPAPMPVALGAPAPDGLVHMIEARLDESALASIASALTGDGPGTMEVRFEALAEPLPATPPVVHADAVFWWSRPPAGWAAWTTIPVVIERAE